MATKRFAVNDVLPATTRLNITSVISDWSVYEKNIKTTDDYLNIWGWADDPAYTTIYIYINGVLEYIYEDDDYYNNIDIIIDTSSWTNDQRTVISANAPVYWEDLNASSGYTISFNSNGGTTIPDIEDATELPTPLPTPTKSGYTFVAWYYESNFQTRAKAGDTIESNVTLYAKWHNLGSLFTEIADAIRSKDGTSEKIRDVDFGERVKQIQGAIELTQAQYDALGTKDANTYYLIVEVE